MVNKIIDQAGLINIDAGPDEPSGPSNIPTPKAALGAWLAIDDRNIGETLKENQRLQAELEAFKTSNLTKWLDPKQVVRSKWANRHKLSFTDKSFMQLRREIETAGGNIQPIKVRPLFDQDAKYEIVFGHRRHQACLDLGVPVLAMIEDLTTQELFSQMDRENRQRKDVRPYEQGVMYAKALAEGLFPSARKMAESMGIDQSNLGKSLSLARLPDDVLNAFENPLEIQLGWASALNAAIQADPDCVLRTAKDLSIAPRLSAKSVFERLTSRGEVSNLTHPLTLRIKGRSGGIASVDMNKNKRTLDISFKNIDPDQADEIYALQRKLLESICIRE